MPIAFDAVPSNALVPLFWPEIRPAQEPINSSLKLLLIGRAEHTSNGPTSTPTILSSASAEEMWGRGSMLAHMYETARLNAGPWAEIWGMAMEKDVDAIAAHGHITVTNVATRDGNLKILIGGRQINITVRPEFTQSQVANKIRNAINAKKSLSVSAAIDVGTPTRVDLTCKWRGVSGERIPITFNFWGNENRFANHMVNLSQNMTGGVGEPSLAFAALGGQAFDVIACADYSSGPRTASMEAFLNGQTGRWSPHQQLYGHIFIGMNNAFADAITWAQAHNDPHLSVIPVDGSATPAWEWGAAVAALATVHWAAPPEISRPLQTLQLRNVLVPEGIDKWWDLTERQLLLQYGLSAWHVGYNRAPILDRIVTTRKTNAWGDPDPSWRDAITMFQAVYFTRFMRSQVTGAFPRAALTDENTGIPGFASPEQIKATLLHAYRFLQQQGLVENYEAFANALIVERNDIDANRVDVLIRADMVNQLRIVAVVVETNLQLRELSEATTPIEGE